MQDLALVLLLVEPKGNCVTKCDRMHDDDDAHATHRPDGRRRKLDLGLQAKRVTQYNRTRKWSTS
jgi:hypothetical protein